jgi:murein DD-endopeptidase MepM/ murein hydrolase activator NlpD
MIRAFWVSITVGLLALLVLPLSGLGARNLPGSISETQAQLEQNRAKESELGGKISELGDRISSLEDEIDGLQQQEATVQRRLDVRTDELNKLRDELDRLRRHLEKLHKKLQAGREALAQRLVERYKQDSPDVITVVLESEGFNDFLERTAFMERIRDQDQDIVTRVTDLKGEVEKEEARVSEVETRVQKVVAQITEQRDQLAATRERKEGTEGTLTDVRQGHKGALADVRADSADLESHLRDLEAEQAAVQGQVGAQAGTYDPGPIKQGSGQLIWPAQGSVTSPFGQRWGRLHAGIDIAMPSGTPLRAADSGKVILASPYGGYGNYTCIQHAGALSTCYAHQSSIGVSVGETVQQGDVIGLSGCTGSCFGDHLHFETRVNGTPQDPMGYL